MDRIPLEKTNSLNLFKQHSMNERLTTHVLGELLKNDRTKICSYGGHPWNAVCFPASFQLFRESLRPCLRMYATLYLLSAILRGRPLKYYYTRLPNEILRSTVFLAANCFFFMSFFCLSRKLFGGISYWGTLFANIPACFLSIIIERKQRRGVLALYLTNLAVETAFKMLVFRNRIKPIANGEVFLFAIASAIYALLFKNKSLDGSIHNIIKMLVGSAECTRTDHSFHKNRQSRVVKYYGLFTTIFNNFLGIVNNLVFAPTSRHHRSHNLVVNFLRNIERKLDQFLCSFSQSANCKHHLCTHRYNCFIYPIVGFVQRFTAGYLLQALVKCISSFSLLLKQPKYLIKILTSPVNRELGMFLGSYAFIFRALSCILRWITNNKSELHGLVAGFFAGFSMFFYKSSSIALYLNFKLFEILWMLGVENKKLPLFKSFDVILYTISTAFILWAALYEPHNLRQGYWKFLINISDSRFAQVNRFVFDRFGVKSSTYDRMLDRVTKPQLLQTSS